MSIPYHPRGSATLWMSGALGALKSTISEAVESKAVSVHKLRFLNSEGRGGVKTQLPVGMDYRWEPI